MSTTTQYNPTGIKPIQDWVIVKLIKEDTKTPLIILQEQREKQQKGVVVDCGKGKYNEKGVFIPVEVRTGDIVHFGVFKGKIIEISGDEFLMMREKDISLVGENVL